MVVLYISHLEKSQSIRICKQFILEERMKAEEARRIANSEIGYLIARIREAANAGDFEVYFDWSLDNEEIKALQDLGYQVIQHVQGKLKTATIKW